MLRQEHFCFYQFSQAVLFFLYGYHESGHVQLFPFFLAAMITVDSLHPQYLEHKSMHTIDGAASYRRLMMKPITLYIVEGQVRFYTRFGRLPNTIT